MLGNANHRSANEYVELLAEITSLKAEVTRLRLFKRVDDKRIKDLEADNAKLIEALEKIASLPTVSRIDHPCDIAKQALKEVK